MSADTFKASTWNMAGGTPKPPSFRTLSRVLDGLLADHVTVVLAQECNRPEMVDIFRNVGLHAFWARPQYVVAWNPDRWVSGVHEEVRLSGTEFHRQGDRHGVPAEGASVILHDIEGRSLDALSYHLPSSVQQARRLPERLTVTRESMATMKTLARRSEADACLFGGDDNVDEHGAFGPWGFMLKAATGLTLVQAPRGTHGDRPIDDFRVRGLVVGHGDVRDGGGDHRVHTRVFRWK